MMRILSGQKDFQSRRYTVQHLIKKIVLKKYIWVRYLRSRGGFFLINKGLAKTAKRDVY